MTDTHGISRVYGVDFSGAADAGKHVWIAEGIVDGDRLRIERCFPASELPGSGVDRARGLAALVDFIANAGSAAFGMDFPFSLPEKLIRASSWSAFIRTFYERFPSAEVFHDWCHRATPGREEKRQTDGEAKTPMSAYNLRLYRQTYHGIRHVLAPLVSSDRVWVLPIGGPPQSGRPWLLEICPTSTRKRHGLHGAKSKDVLDYLKGSVGTITISDALHQYVLDNSEKRRDPIDSVLAAEATFRAIQDRSILEPPASPYDLEGKVYG